MRIRPIQYVAASLIAVGLLCVPAAAQQRTDSHYRPHVRSPAYAGNGPVIAIDEAHRNFHTLGGRYAPFGKLAEADGYRPLPETLPFSPSVLKGVAILVVANARSPDRGGSAFSSGEIAAVRNWVSNGGSLLLISDHAPFGTASAALAEAFGVKMGLGYVVSAARGRPSSQIDFDEHQLGTHPILDGRNGSERVKWVESFTGQSLQAPPDATTLLRLPDDSLEVGSPAQIDELARGERVASNPVGGGAQAVALTFGSGRVVIAGEAAMFTAQTVTDRGGTWRMGLKAHDDEQFALNVLHWLSRVI